METRKNDFQGYAKRLTVSLVLLMAVFFAMMGVLRSQGESSLHCHLIAKEKSDQVDGSFPGVFELRNDTKRPIAIEYLDDMTEHLSLDITDPAGKPMPKDIPYYGGMYATVRMLDDMHNKTLVLQPGETYRANLMLFGQVYAISYPLTPGNYTIEAVFNWDGTDFKSNQVTVEARAR